MAPQTLGGSVGSFAIAAFILDDLNRLLVRQMRVLPMEVLDLIRLGTVVATGTLLVHGINKLMGPGVVAFAQGLARRGIEPSLPFAYWIFFAETIGAIMVMLGLFTRFFAAAIAIEFCVITFVAHWPNGYGWTNPRGGWEYPLMWGLLFFAIALRGGGPYSLDRKIGREL